MATLNLLDDLTLEVGDDFNPSVATPRELSEIALAVIEQYPNRWSEDYWHLWTQSPSLHSYLGFIDILLGAENTPGYLFLQNPLKELLGLSDEQFELLAHHQNTLEKLRELHRSIFES